MIIDEEFERLKQAFSKVNCKDPASLYRWFTAYQDLSVADHALIMGKCTAWVRKLRIFAGIKGCRPKTAKRFKELPKVIAGKPDVHNIEWLSTNIEKYGVSAVARIAGVSRMRIYAIMKRKGLKGPGLSSKNPYCNQAWCHKHYVELQWTETKCAKEAGITRSKFVDWLIKFKIPIRPLYIKQDHGIQLPFYIKRSLKNLKAYPTVTKVRMKNGILEIRHSDSLRTRLFYSAMTQEDWQFRRVPNIHDPYNKDLESNQASAHICINRKQLNKCSKIERHVILHKFNMIINRRGWIQPEFPLEELQKDLVDLRNIELSKCIKNGALRVNRYYFSGRTIMQHYFDMSALYDQILRKPRKTWNMIQYVACDTGGDISLSNLLKAIANRSHRDFRFKMPRPSIYAVLFKKLNLSGSILDLHVNYGSRAIGAAINNLEYQHLNDSNFNKAIENGFDLFTGLKHKPFDGKVDTVISDNDLLDEDSENRIINALSYAKQAKRIVVFVGKQQKAECYAKFRPRFTIPISTRIPFTDPDFYFIW